MPSSRVAYGIAITPVRLARVERAEAELRSALTAAGHAVADLRVRDLGEDARVEVDRDLVGVAEDYLDVVRAAGFARAEVDPLGFRSGSMNELLPRARALPLTLAAGRGGPNSMAAPSAPPRTLCSRSPTNRKASAVPTGKVKWYDAEKGFGFLSREEGEDVYVRSSSLPEGVTTLKAGTRVEFGVLSGRKGDQAHQVRVLDAPASVAQNQRAAQRKKPEEMAVIVEDLIRVLDGIGEAYGHGRRPDPKSARPAAKLLRGLADELEL